MKPRTRWLLAGLALLAPLALAPAAQRALVPRIAAAMARPLVAAASFVSAAATPEPTPADPAILAAPSVEPRRAPAPPAVCSATRRTPESTAPHIVVSQERLLHLTADQLRTVGWATVVGLHGRASGVRLSGVAPLGVGLADGDVVTSINGQPTPTEDDATAAGAAAWVSGATAARATVLRGGQTIAVTLELPRREGGYGRY